MCQEHGDNAVVPLEETNVVTVVSCSPGEFAYGGAFIPALCDAFKNSDRHRKDHGTECDLYEILVTTIVAVQAKYGEATFNEDGKPMRGPQNPTFTGTDPTEQSRKGLLAKGVDPQIQHPIITPLNNVD